MKSSFLKYAAVTALAASSIAYVAVAPTEAATPFKDIPAVDKDLQQAVDSLYNQGYITGRTSTQYAPSQVATRAETALFIANAIGIDQVNVKDPGFVDVSKSNKYYGAIAALYNAGIISGSKRADGKIEFRPDSSVKRAHIGKMITLAFDLDVASSSTTKFTDVNKINDANTRQYIQTLVNYNITTGTSPTTFDPYKEVSRGQLAKFLYRAIESTDQEELTIIDIQ